MTWVDGSRKVPWAYLDGLEPEPNAPVSDNPSGLWCRDCRDCGAFHCAHPDYCGGLKPMRPKEVGQ